jgi:hypothetical protein
VLPIYTKIKELADVTMAAEMEFLDISLTKDSSLLLHVIRSPFYWRILKKPILLSGFNNPYQKIRETRKLEFSNLWNKLESEKTHVYAHLN